MSSGPSAVEGLGGEPDSTALDRTRQLFRFLHAFAQKREPTQRTLSDVPWVLGIRDLPSHACISVSTVNLSGNGDSNDPQEVGSPPSLIRVARPTLTRPPAPPASIADWALRGWEDPISVAPQVMESRNEKRGRETVTVRFDEDPERVAALVTWMDKWNAWAPPERAARAAMKVFERLYALKGNIDRESERVELLLGDGRLRWVTAQGATDFPIILQRVELEFDPDVPEFRVVDADRAPELSSALLQESSELPPARLNDLRLELERSGLHPLARDETSAWLRRVVQLLGPHGQFEEERTSRTAGPDPLIERGPVLLLRRRSGGYVAAFDRVLQALEDAPPLPVALTRLVGVEPDEPDADGAKDQEQEGGFSRVWSEPPDVLLSKPANQEQIQIARAVERQRAVLVQGPPGTGKSHTIANLIGHLVAQGKRVLVTSHTTKALRVLRGHVVENIRSLCVSVLDNDLATRSELESSVRQILARLTQSSEASLAREADELARRRNALNAEIERITRLLRDAREAEYREIVLSGETVEPVKGTIWVREHAAGNDWIPGKLAPAAPLPLGRAEVEELYGTNSRITPAEESEVSSALPEYEKMPTAAQFGQVVVASGAAPDKELSVFWKRDAGERELDALSELLSSASRTASELQRLVPWQRAVVRAGASGGPDARLWSELGDGVRKLSSIWEDARPRLMEHAPAIDSGLELETVRDTCQAIGLHLEQGGSLGWWALLRHRRWKPLLAGMTVNEKPPSAAAHFEALQSLASLRLSRDAFALRWERLAQAAGMPAFDAFPDPPEPTLSEYAGQFEPLLGWWIERWSSIERLMEDAGFCWDDFRAREVARGQPAAPFDRDAELLGGPLLKAIEHRQTLALGALARSRLGKLEGYLAHFPGTLCRALLGSVQRRSAAEYERAIDAVRRLGGLKAVATRRRALLVQLAQAAPEWARAIGRRHGIHGAALPPGDAAIAWRWRQLQQEIERRNALDEAQLTRDLERRRVELREATAQLVDRLAWLAQVRRTDLAARQALQGWADTVRKIGKGMGKRVPALQAEARELLAQARNAVPVWIMPLARVAESFDPSSPRFDVVIVDEASQSDVTGLLAWYLGDRIVVVGDHEQVSPLAVGDTTEAADALIAQHLQGIPNDHLYDGKTSIYDLARQCFGGTIALREHFRCVPAIIEFSNSLSYEGRILPLRAPGSVRRPHVLEFVVPADMQSGKTGKTNEGEARALVAIAQALIERPELEGRSMGAITLLGNEQASLIQDLLLPVIGAVEIERRRFVAGNAAQFQGDERDIMFLSMVDTPTGSPLRLSQLEATKQRYNVAASRARDHMWLIHSLDPNVDLKTGDLRRRLIEHVRDPESRLRETERLESRAESEFEKEVIRRLVSADYRVEPQVWVGRYRIDMVVSCGTNQVAVECDGDRFHPPDKIPEDMARQATLERMGWRFVRIRGTRFYRAPDETTNWLRQELSRFGVEPTGIDTSASNGHVEGAEFRDAILARAYEIMQKQGWLGAAGAADAGTLIV